RGNRRAHGPREKNAGVRDHKKGGPENCRADGKMIFNVAGAGVKFSGRLAVFVEAIFAKAGVGFLIVAGKIEIVLDQRSTREGVIADAVSAHPGIEHGQGKQEEHEKKALCFARTWLRR